MDNESVLAFLEQVSILKGLRRQQVQELHAKMKPYNLAKGGYVIREGDQGDALYVLLQGTVQISKKMTLKTASEGVTAKDKVLIKLSQDQHPFFGEMSLLGTDTRSADVIALTDCECLELARTAFEEFCHQKPYAGLLIAREIGKTIAQRLKKSNQDVLKLTTALSLALS